MDYRKLRYFKAVGEERSFHQAADTLRVSQPALTRPSRNLKLSWVCASSLATLAAWI